MNSSAFTWLKNFRPAWLVWLRRELAPFPGRTSMTIRLMVTVAIVTVISMTLHVPQLAFSAFFCFFVTKENNVLTLFTGMLMIFGITIATVINLLLYTSTFDYPELRIPVMACLIFCALFLSRTFAVGPLGFSIGFFSTLMLVIGEGAPDTEILVRNELWLWVAVVYPIALTIFINQLLLPSHPWTSLVQALELRLNAAATALQRVIKEGSAGGQTNQPLLNLATRGCAVMLGYLHFAEMKEPALKRRHPFLVETISAASHLVNATASLEFRQPQALSPDDILRAKGLLAEIEELKAILPEKEPAGLSSRTAPLPQPALPQLREMQFALESFRDTLIRGPSDYSSTNVVKASKPWFGSDAFTNPVYVQFALKVTFSAMICYIMYSALHWPGISTSFVTCAFIALGNTGASLYKGWLRFFGCLAGGLAGYLAIFLFIPHMVSITSLILLAVAGSALAGWIASGTERISYAGLQFAFAFYLSIFQGLQPEVDLATIRDRVLGILLGTFVSAVMFRYVWPEHAADQLRATLSKVLRTLSELVSFPHAGVAMEAGAGKAKSLHDTLSKDLDNVLVLAEQAAVENAMFDNPKSFSATLLEHITSHIQALGLITTALLRRTKLEEWQLLDRPAQASETELRNVIAAHLQRLADSMENGRPLPVENFESALAKWNLTASGITQNDRPRLVRRLADQVHSLTG